MTDADRRAAAEMLRGHLGQHPHQWMLSGDTDLAARDALRAQLASVGIAYQAATQCWCQECVAERRARGETAWPEA